MIITDPYKINIERFEGPLDLLLFLIRKNDLNIYDIPISFITEEYLKYLGTLQEFNIDLAGEFLAMASELMLIKSRMLLPQEKTEEEEEIDPRAELARRLLEYQRIKMAVKMLYGRPLLGRNVFSRGGMDVVETGAEEFPLKGETYQLLEAFAEVLKRIPKELYHEIAVDRISINQKICQLIELFNEKSTLLLEELLPQSPQSLTRYDVVITLLALLEMARLKMIRVHQDEKFGKIAIRKAMEVLSTQGDIPLVEEDAWRG